jgi:hypothetical protein
MRKALFPMLASLLLSGAATAAVVISTAHAQPATHNPVMLAQADNTSQPSRRGPNRPAPANISQRLSQLCQDRVARQTGDLAYLETRLSLTQSEQPLFQRWKNAKLTIAHRQADQCGQRVNERVTQRQNAQNSQTGQNQARTDRPGPGERMGREEDRLKQRLADIDVERPALEAFYNALSPEQKMTFERAGARGRDGMRTRRFAFGGGPRGPMGRMGRLPMPPQGPGAPPSQDR